MTASFRGDRPGTPRQPVMLGVDSDRDPFDGKTVVVYYDYDERWLAEYPVHYADGIEYEFDPEHNPRGFFTGHATRALAIVEGRRLARELRLRLRVLNCGEMIRSMHQSEREQKDARTLRSLEQAVASAQRLIILHQREVTRSAAALHRAQRKLGQRSSRAPRQHAESRHSTSHEGPA